MLGRTGSDRTLRLIGGIPGAEQSGQAYLIQAVGCREGARLDRLSGYRGKGLGVGGPLGGGGRHHGGAEAKGGDGEESSASWTPGGTLSERAGGTWWFRGAA